MKPEWVEAGRRAAHMQNTQSNRDKVAAIIEEVEPLILAEALVEWRSVDEQVFASAEEAARYRVAEAIREAEDRAAEMERRYDEVTLAMQRREEYLLTSVAALRDGALRDKDRLPVGGGTVVAGAEAMAYNTILDLLRGPREETP